MRLQVIVLVLGLSLLYAAPVVPAQLSGESSGAVVCIDERYECWRGVPAADVKLKQDGLLPTEYTAKTDKEGYFEFSGVQSGDYTMTISRAGFLTATSTVTYPFQKDQFALEPKRLNVSGQVADEAGSGIAGAEISTWSEYGASEARTGSDGAFKLSVHAGYRNFDVWAQNYVRLSQEIFVDGSAISLTLAEAPPSDASVSGLIKDQDGKPVSGVTVQGYQWGYYSEQDARYSDYGYDERQMRAVSDAQGSYRLEARAGDLNLNFYKEGYAGTNAYLTLESGDDLKHDVKMLKYPEKTARIEGKLFDAATGKALSWGSINFQSVEYGIYGCSQYESQQNDRYAQGSPEPAVAMEDSPDGDYAYAESSIAPYPYYQDCDITIHDDGTFSGNVTPGYTTVNVWFDHWRTCTESSSSDGSYSRTCGKDYFGWVGTFVLAENSVTKMNIGLEPRPGADATVQGYAVDKDSGKAIPGARFSFSNQDGYAWGEAQTDKDGSYKVKIRSGYQHVNVWADGYFPWQGVVKVTKDGTLNFDVEMTKGEARYGGYCCYAYNEDMAYPSTDGAKGGSTQPSSGAAQAPEGVDGAGSGEASSNFEDLNGGLGPYDAAKRAKTLDSGKESPGLSIMLLVGMLGALVWVQRRN